MEMELDCLKIAFGPFKSIMHTLNVAEVSVKVIKVENT